MDVVEVVALRNEKLYLLLVLFDAIRSGQVRERNAARDPNLAQVELIAHVLGSLREELVFFGGCAVGLLMTDPAASPARVT